MGLLLSLLASLALGGGQGQRMDFGITLKDAKGNPSGLVMIRTQPLEPPKLSPRKFPPRNQRWEFDWVVSCYGNTGADQNELRFRIFSQQRKEVDADPAQLAGRQALRMWGLLREKLNFEHSQVAKDLRLVDVYLAWGGEAGGEQEFTEDTEGGHRRRANTIYIYDLGTFRQPLEMARELAHEYGHAVLPAIGGFRSPEDWGNGFLGERLFLKWLRDGQREGHFVPEDMMGASLPELDVWVRQNVDPLVLAAATSDPTKSKIGGRGQDAMNAFLGLALYAEAILPKEVFSKTLQVIGSVSAADYPDSIVEACAGRTFEVRIPAALLGKAIWLPLGTSRVAGAKVLAKSGGWAKVQPSSAILRVAATD